MTAIVLNNDNLMGTDVKSSAAPDSHLFFGYWSTKELVMSRFCFGNISTWILN
jgi:hypothetical protein